jgi:hypothetical protein
MTWIHRAIASFLLLAYSAVGTSTYVATVAVLASIDGSHEMSVSLAPDGASLTLSHTKGNFTPEVADHQGVLGKVVTELCMTARNRDHCLSADCLSAAIDSSRHEVRSQDTPSMALDVRATSLLESISFRPSSPDNNTHRNWERVVTDFSQPRLMMATVQMLV